MNSPPWVERVHHDQVAVTGVLEQRPQPRAIDRRARFLIDVDLFPVHARLDPIEILLRCRDPGVPKHHARHRTGCRGRSESPRLESETNFRGAGHRLAATSETAGAVVFHFQRCGTTSATADRCAFRAIQEQLAERARYLRAVRAGSRFIQRSCGVIQDACFRTTPSLLSLEVLTHD